MSSVGLGRVHVPDARDSRFPMGAILPTATPRTHRYWNSQRWNGDQGGTSQCVVYSWAHWAERPNNRVTPWRSNGGHLWDRDRKTYVYHGQRPLIDLDMAYNWAQRNDEWAGEAYDGTSVRAGAKYMQAQRLISNYYWAYDLNTINKAILERGPVVVGTAWMMDMFRLNDKGFISATGPEVGGHAYVLDGVNTVDKFYRIKNSWGKNWGRSGYARISFADMDILLSNYGEACLAIQ
jgi:C1A family cysteine protease